jgi:MYXO-CTERM domain-containing protein
MAKALVSVLFVALALSVAPRASAQAAKDVSCVGDSITQYSGWCEKLQTLLGSGYVTHNYGVSGTTLINSADFPYTTTQQYTDSKSIGPDIVVIMLGTNDSKSWNWSHSADYVPDYEALIDSYTALSSKPRVMICLPPPAGVNTFSIPGDVIENEVLPMVREVAAAKGVELIDVFDAMGGHNLNTSYFSATDQVHPNAAGAQVIADTVYAAITSPQPDAGVVVDASARESGTGGAKGSGGGAGTGGVAKTDAAAADETDTGTDGASSGCSCSVAPRPPQLAALFALLALLPLLRRRAARLYQ